MVVLESGANTINLTLAEKATLVDPVYIFIFVNDNTGEKFMVTSTYTTVKDVLQQFTITVQSSPDWTAGEVELSKYGFYHYYAYERANITGLVYNTVIAADISTYVPTYFTTLVERGKMHFDAPDTTINTYINTVTSVKAYGE